MKDPRLRGTKLRELKKIIADAGLEIEELFSIWVEATLNPDMFERYPSLDRTLTATLLTADRTQLGVDRFLSALEYQLKRRESLQLPAFRSWLLKGNAPTDIAAVIRQLLQYERELIGLIGVRELGDVDARVRDVRSIVIELADAADADVLDAYLLTSGTSSDVVAARSELISAARQARTECDRFTTAVERANAVRGRRTGGQSISARLEADEAVDAMLLYRKEALEEPLRELRLAIGRRLPGLAAADVAVAGPS